MLRRIVVITLGLALVGLTGCNQLKELEQQNESLGAQLSVCRQRTRTLEQDLESARDEISTLTQQLTDAQADARRYSQLAQRLEEAKERLEDEKEAMAKIVEDLDWLVNLEERGDETVMVMENDILFPSGSHELTEKAKGGLGELANRLQEVADATIRIDGHTDGEPIRASADKYSSNWDLAAERAESVRAYLADEGVSSGRMYITGFGPNVPRVTPPSPTAAVEENRRVEIVLLFDRTEDVESLLEGLEETEDEM